MSRVYFLSFYYALNCVFVAEPFAIAITLPLFLLCCLNMYRINETFVVAEDMVWLIVYLFFVIGPCQSIGDGYIGKATGPVAGVSFTDQEIIQASVIVFSFFATVTLTKLLLGGAWVRPRAIGQVRIDGAQAIPLLLVCLGAFAAFVIFSGGLSNVLASRADKLRQEVSALAVVFLALQIIATLLIVVVYRTNLGAKLPLVAVLLTIPLLAVSQNPLNAPRYFLLAAWLPILFVVLKGRIRVFYFYLSVFFGITVVMPVFSLTSRFGHSFSDAFGNVSIQEAVFHLPYIDVFDMLAYEVKYLATSDFYWGEKTLGMLLFFVPRSIWPTKATLLAIDMGTDLTEAKIAGTPNLSMFFAGEFYSDFGILGVVAGAFVLTLAFIWLNANRKYVNGLDVRSFVFIAAVPILVRGPLGANAPLSMLEFLFLAMLTSFLGARLRYHDRTSRLVGPNIPRHT